MNNRRHVLVLPLLWLILGHGSIFAEQEPPLAGPYLQDVRQDSLAVCWISSNPDGRSRVEVTVGGRRRIIDAATAPFTHFDGFFRHQASISGLTPGAEGRYRILGAGRNQQYRFRTAPPEGTPIRALLISDLQLKPLGPSTAKAILAMHRERPFDLAICAGDIAEYVDDPQNWFEHPESLALFDLLASPQNSLLAEIPFYSAVGNHDVSSTNGETPLERYAGATPDNWNTDTFEEMLVLPEMPEKVHRRRLKRRNASKISSGPECFYSFTYGNVFVAVTFAARKWKAALHDPPLGPTYQPPGRFIFEPVRRGSPQFKWLKKTLNGKPAQRADYRLVILHHPVFSQGENIIPPFGEPVDYQEDYLVEQWAPLLQQSKADLVLNGHGHVHGRYRQNNTHYLEASSFGNSYQPYARDQNGRVLAEPHGAPTMKWERLEGETEFSVLDSSQPGTVTSYRVRDGAVVGVVDRFQLTD